MTKKRIRDAKCVTFHFSIRLALESPSLPPTTSLGSPNRSTILADNLQLVDGPAVRSFSCFRGTSSEGDGFDGKRSAATIGGVQSLRQLLDCALRVGERGGGEFEGGDGAEIMFVSAVEE